MAEMCPYDGRSFGLAYYIYRIKLYYYRLNFFHIPQIVIPNVLKERFFKSYSTVPQICFHSKFQSLTQLQLVPGGSENSKNATLNSLVSKRFREKRVARVVRFTSRGTHQSKHPNQKAIE